MFHAVDLGWESQNVQAVGSTEDPRKIALVFSDTIPRTLASGRQARLGEGHF